MASSSTEAETFIRSRPGVLEESAIRRASRRQLQQQSRPPSSTTGRNTTTTPASTILDEELAQVAEAKRISEQEAGGAFLL